MAASGHKARDVILLQLISGSSILGVAVCLISSLASMVQVHEFLGVPMITLHGSLFEIELRKHPSLKA